MTAADAYLEHLWAMEWPDEVDAQTASISSRPWPQPGCRALHALEPGARWLRAAAGAASRAAPDPPLRQRAIAALQRQPAARGGQERLALALAEMNLITAGDTLAVLRDRSPDTGLSEQGWSAVEAVSPGPGRELGGVHVIWVARFPAGLTLGWRFPRTVEWRTTPSTPSCRCATASAQRFAASAVTRAATASRTSASSPPPRLRPSISSSMSTRSS